MTKHSRGLDDRLEYNMFHRKIQILALSFRVWLASIEVNHKVTFSFRLGMSSIPVRQKVYGKNLWVDILSNWESARTLFAVALEEWFSTFGSWRPIIEYSLAAHLEIKLRVLATQKVIATQMWVAVHLIRNCREPKLKKKRRKGCGNAQVVCWEKKVKNL